MVQKITTSILLILIMLYCEKVFGQICIPDVTIRSLDGEAVSTSLFKNDAGPFVICFWKSCCNSSLKFMESFNDLYPELVDDYNIIVFAISIDDTRTSDKIKPFVNGCSWEFDFYLDTNKEFARAMNINLTPHCILFNSKRNQVWEKSVCMDGDEFVIEEELSKLSD